MSEEDKKSTLKACLEESSNDRMKNYVKILDEPGITTFEWIHRTQERIDGWYSVFRKVEGYVSDEYARVGCSPFGINKA